jgi:hypothetical protein
VPKIDGEILSLMNISSDLNPYAVAARYPKQLVSDETEAKVVIDKAQNVYDFCAAKIPAPQRTTGEESEEGE